MGIIINRRRVMGKKLPYDAEIEYLESTGTQWIDTGIDGNSIYGVELTFISANSVGAYDSILSCVLDDFTLGYFVGSNQVYLRNREKQIFRGVSITQSLENNLLMMDKEAIFNGVTYQISTPIASGSQNLLIANNSAYSRPAHAKYKTLKLYQDVLVRDFIPVRIGTTGYMYDKVSGQLFGNSGTGEFILGPDVNSDNSWNSKAALWGKEMLYGYTATNKITISSLTTVKEVEEYNYKVDYFEN